MPTAVIEPAEVRRIAELARLTLSDQEVDKLAFELGAILEYVAKLEELDIAGVPPTAHAVDLPATLREDEVNDGLPVDSALGGAPERIGDGFGVPKIIE